MEKPTRVRHAVLMMVCLVCFIAYIDRVNISVAAPAVMRELSISKVELGVVFAAFSVGYIPFQVPIGRLGDRLGPRKVLTGLVGFWSAMTWVTGLAWNLWSLVLFRVLFGAGQAGAFPNATRAFAAWAPPSGRGLVQGVTQAAARLGAAVAPVILAPMMVFWGWRPVFYLCALIGFLWGAWWYFWYRDEPDQHQARWGSVNAAERALIEGGRTADQVVPRLPLGRLIASRNMWLLCASYFCYCYCLYIYLTWLPTYLTDARGFSFLGMGLFAGIPLLIGGLGAALGGWVSDKVGARTGSIRLSRRLVAGAGMLWAAIFVIPGVMTDSPLLSVLFLTLAIFGLELSVGIYWAVCLDIGHEYAGTVSGMMNSIGGIGSILSPFLFGLIVEYSGSWMYPFLAASVLLVAGAALWLRIDPEMTISKELRLDE
jgi:MFS family permease